MFPRSKMMTVLGGGFRFPFSDNFDRADGALGGKWQGSSTFQIATNKAVNTPGIGANLFAAGKGTFDATTESWVAFGANTIEVDAGALKTTYVNNVNGAQLYLNSTKDLSTNLTVGKWYRLEFDAWVSAGATAGLTVANPDEFTGITNITNTTPQTFHIIFRCKHATNCNIYSNGLAAGEIIWLDNIKLYQINDADLFGAIKGVTTPTFVVKAAVTVDIGEQAGVWFGDAANPTNCIVAQYDRLRVRPQVYKKVGATYTTVQDITAAYSAGALLELRRTAATTFQVWYNNAQVGADLTIGDVDGIYWGIFSTAGGSQLDSFFLAKS